jgi:hypothetical protein
MLQLRETIKQTMPRPLREFLTDLRDRLASPTDEDLVLHDYQMSADLNARHRLTLVIPTIAPERAFGGVTTCVEIFLECGKRAGADLRILIDKFERGLDRTVVDDIARTMGLDPAAIEVVPRSDETPVVPVRSGDVFFAHSWWCALNAASLVEQQAKSFGGPRKPLIYLIQEYEPGFYPFSAIQMHARSALDLPNGVWGIFNSSQLRDYVHAHGHKVEREFLFEPRLSSRLAPFLDSPKPAKEKRILVYGRPGIARNCFPAILKGLGAWAKTHPEYSDWPIVSAGLRHRPIQVAKDRSLESLGKLSLEQYARLLLTTPVGLSLMASPHPSYPPLEMAHFGVRTITNTFENKNLASAHENIISIGDIRPETIAEALAAACKDFELAPEAGWRRRSNMPAFTEEGPFPFLDELVRDLRAAAWA